MGEKKYQLSAELDPSHLSDVKAVLAIDNDVIASASRDSSVAVWKRGHNDKFSLACLLNGHHAYVNSLAHIPPDTDTDEGFIASGGNSTLILLHSLNTLDSESRHCLLGHSLNVCALSYSPTKQELISGSWDCTARVWQKTSDTWETRHVLEGHEEGVWGVAIVDAGPKEGCYLTGSADRLINLWSAEAELIGRFKGSPEPVRGLGIFPDGQTFASACNDGLIRVWDFTGSVVRIIRGHKDYVYHIEIGQEAQLLSCGEDHTARVWNDGGSASSILHPCQTVWAATFLPNGDIVTGGSDGKVRIWTTSAERIAAIEDRERYDDKIRSILTPTALSDAPQSHESHSTDLTIDIDVSDDSPPIPLVHRAGADPRATAEEFGNQHGFSERYIDSLEAFIRAHIDQL